MERDEMFEQVRAAQTYARTARSPQRQADIELSAFMAIFHPEVPDEKIRDMLRDQRRGDE